MGLHGQIPHGRMGIQNVIKGGGYMLNGPAGGGIVKAVSADGPTDVRMIVMIQIHNTFQITGVAHIHGIG